MEAPRTSVVPYSFSRSIPGIADSAATFQLAYEGIVTRNDIGNGAQLRIDASKSRPLNESQHSHVEAE